jgi:hypothetical protein
MTGYDREADEHLTDGLFDSFLLKPVEIAAFQDVLADTGRTQQPEIGEQNAGKRV